MTWGLTLGAPPRAAGEAGAEVPGRPGLPQLRQEGLRLPARAPGPAPWPAGAPPYLARRAGRGLPAVQGRALEQHQPGGAHGRRLRRQRDAEPRRRAAQGPGLHLLRRLPQHHGLHWLHVVRNHPTSVCCGCARSSALTIVGRAETAQGLERRRVLLPQARAQVQLHRRRHPGRPVYRLRNPQGRAERRAARRLCSRKVQLQVMVPYELLEWCCYSSLRAGHVRLHPERCGRLVPAEHPAQRRVRPEHHAARALAGEGAGGGAAGPAAAAAAGAERVAAAAAARAAAARRRPRLSVPQRVAPCAQPRPLLPQPLHRHLRKSTCISSSSSRGRGHDAHRVAPAAVTPAAPAGPRSRR